MSGPFLTRGWTWHFGTHIWASGCLYLEIHKILGLLLSYPYFWMSWAMFSLSPENMVQPLHVQWGRLRECPSGTHFSLPIKSNHITSFAHLINFLDPLDYNMMNRMHVRSLPDVLMDLTCWDTYLGKRLPLLRNTQNIKPVVLLSLVLEVLGHVFTLTWKLGPTLTCPVGVAATMSQRDTFFIAQ